MGRTYNWDFSFDFHSTMTFLSIVEDVGRPSAGFTNASEEYGNLEATAAVGTSVNLLTSDRCSTRPRPALRLEMVLAYNTDPNALSREAKEKDPMQKAAGTRWKESIHGKSQNLLWEFDQLRA